MSYTHNYYKAFTADMIYEEAMKFVRPYCNSNTVTVTSLPSHTHRIQCLESNLPLSDIVIDVDYYIFLK